MTEEEFRNVKTGQRIYMTGHPNNLFVVTGSTIARDGTFYLTLDLDGRRGEAMAPEAWSLADEQMVLEHHIKSVKMIAGYDKNETVRLLVSALISSLEEVSLPIAEFYGYINSIEQALHSANERHPINTNSYVAV